MKILPILFIFIFALCAFGQEKFQVEIYFSGDKDIETDVRSFVARELRSLGDVEVGERGGYKISIVAFKDTSGGRPIGYSVAVTFSEVIFCDGKVYFDLLNVYLFSGGRNDLRKIAENIGTSFDVDVLEERRKKNK